MGIMMDTIIVVRQLNMKQGNQQGNQQNTFYQVMQNRMCCIPDQIFAIIIRNNLRIRRQHFLIDLYQFSILKL